jgi:phosphatidylglycerol:prolipoprotein diacylglycerol transferase
MHPVLFWFPEVPAWVAASAVLLLGGVFALLALRQKSDAGSWVLSAACGVGAVAILAGYGASAPVGPLPVRLFGVLVVLGFLAGAWVLSARNRRLGLLDGEETFDLAFYMLLAGIAGARFVHVVQNSDQFSGHPVEMLKIWDGGLVWYGGAIAATLFAWYWLAKRKKDLWAVSDSVALAAPVGHAIGRIGCFLAGCDYGKVVPGGRDALPWAVHFPVPNAGEADNCLVPLKFRYDAENDLPVWIHPAQLYEAGALLLLFGLLWVVDRKVAKGAFRGRLAALYCMLYGVERFVVEFWRGDVDRGEYLGGTISFSQILSILFLLGGVAMYRSLRARAKAPGAAQG